MDWLKLIEHHGVVSSTMQVARERALQGAREGTTVVADAQDLGRGRRGRSWYSPAGAGLWMTTILRPPTNLPWPLTQLSLAAGVALWQCLRELAIENVALKWPNDVMVGERKLAGILAEAEQLDSPASFVLIGIGLNLSATAQLALPAEIGDRYVGLLDVLAADSELDSHSQTALRDAILPRVLAALDGCYQAWQRQGAEWLAQQWRRADALCGIEVTAETASGRTIGIARGITSSGELRLETPLGLQHISHGEVEKVRGAR